MVNDVWSERWRGDWELVLLVDGEHAGVLMMLVLAEKVLMVLALVLLVRW